MELYERYRENPFYLLQAAAASTRAELIEKQEEMALFGDGEKAEQALSALLNPQTRIEAEMQWFPHMSALETQQLIRFFSLHREEIQWPQKHISSMLAHFHMLRLVLSPLPISTEAQCMAVLQSLSVSADTLLPGQIMEELNADRERAGFPEIRTRKEVEIQIRNLLEETAKAFLAKMAGSISPEDRKHLSQRLKEQYQSAGSPYHNSYFLELASDFLISAV